MKVEFLEKNGFTGLGYIKTEFRLDRITVNSSSSICVGYWIAYVRKTQILQINCLSTYPRWMHEMR
jgi:hypothetical protein